MTDKPPTITEPTSSGGPVPAEPAEPTPEEMVQAALDVESQRRLWLRAITNFIKERSFDSDPSGRVQLAADLAHVAAFERIGRILRSDLGPDQL